MAPTPPRSMSPARWSRGARRQPDVSVCLLVRAKQVEWGPRVATRGQGAFSVPIRTHKTNLRTKPTQPTLPCGHATLVTRSPPSPSTYLPHHPATRHTNRLDKHAPVHTNPCQQHPTLNKEKKNLARPTTRHHPHTRATPQRLTTTPLCLVSSLAPNTHTRGPPPLKAPTTQQDAHPRGSLHHPAGRAASGPASTFPPVSSILPTSTPGGPKAAKRVTPRPKPAAGRCQREQPLAGKSHRQAPSPYQRQPAPGTNAGGKSQPPTIANGRLPSKLAANGIPPPSPPAACRQRQRQWPRHRHRHQPPAVNTSVKRRSYNTEESPVVNISAKRHFPASASTYPLPTPTASAIPPHQPTPARLYRQQLPDGKTRRRAPSTSRTAATGADANENFIPAGKPGFQHHSNAKQWPTVDHARSRRMARPATNDTATPMRAAARRRRLRHGPPHRQTTAAGCER